MRCTPRLCGALTGALLALALDPALGRAEGDTPAGSADQIAQAAPLADIETSDTEGDDAARTSKPADASEGLALGLYGGAFLPRSDLPLSPLAGLDVAFALAGPLRILGGADWTLLSEQQSGLLSPPSFPRSAGSFIQSTHVFTVYAGLGYRLVAIGDGEIAAGAALALSVTRTEVEAYTTTLPDNDVGPGVLAEAALRYPVGPARLSLLVSWREALHDFGAAGDAGEEVVSGLFAGAGVGLAL